MPVTLNNKTTMPTSQLTPTESLADKYVEWSAKATLAAMNLQRKGGDASRLLLIAQKAALKAQILLKA